MEFTNDPIILSIISPREGKKLELRNTKLERGQPYTVDSVEVVSFGLGGSNFFRSVEHPFLLPSEDFEVVESKMPRNMLKSAHAPDLQIKIGDGSKESKEKEPQQERKRSRRRRSGKSSAEPREEKSIDKEATKPKPIEVLPPPAIEDFKAKAEKKEAVPFVDDSSDS